MRARQVKSERSATIPSLHGLSLPIVPGQTGGTAAPPPKGRKMTLRFIRLARAAAFAGALTAAGTAAAQAPFNEAQRREIGDVVKEYLLKNPEILRDAMVELERRETESQKASQKTALSQSRDMLLNSGRDVVAGNARGDITVVEFFDYNCGYCKRALTDMQALLKGDPKIRMVLKDFPVLGPDSVEASRAALAAKRQLGPEKQF
ncbi:MAG TPA: thioredoxin domain-containing protein, partial [Beijerinckiaceae bacterium]|nr:thioredoxin domain-containing protein [Beijerinckiaceae bacterium]